MSLKLVLFLWASYYSHSAVSFNEKFLGSKIGGFLRNIVDPNRRKDVVASALKIPNMLSEPPKSMLKASKGLPVYYSELSVSL